MARLWYNRIAARAADGFFLNLARSGKLVPPARAKWHNLDHIRNVPYLEGGGPDHVLDVYRPLGPGPFPSLLYIHGGGFRALSKDSHYLMALAFARAGFVVFNINYRLAPKAQFPAAIEDTCAAWTWITGHAGRFGGNPENIGVSGESAGANLTAALVVATCFERPEPYAQRAFETGVVPRFAVPACGIFQVSDCARFGGRRLRDRAIMAVLRDVEDCYLPDSGNLDTTMADPLLLLESDTPSVRPLPPFFIPAAGRDPLREDSLRLEGALRAREVEATCEIYPGEMHAFHALIWRKHARACWRQTLRFARRCAGIRSIR